jgi:glycine oxidase
MTLLQAPRSQMGNLTRYTSVLMTTPHSIILGAGLMGRLMAMELLERGHTIDLYEAQGPEAQGSAAKVAAAMLAPLAESAITELNVVKMGQHSLQRWPMILSKLQSSVFFQQIGTVIVWHRADAPEARRFQALVQKTHAQLPTLAAAQSLNARELQTIEPELVPKFHAGLYLPQEGQLDNRELLSALLAKLEEAHARGQLKLHWHSPQELKTLVSLHHTKGPHRPWIIDCTGMGAKPHWSLLRGVRGEVLRLHAPDVHLSRPIRLMHPKYPIYIAPKADHVFVVGATEVESEDRSEVSVRSGLELMSAAYSVHPGFAEARVLEINTQLRPTLADNLPQIHIESAKVIKINGLYRHGFMISPAVLDCALEWIEHQSTGLAQALGLSVLES